MLDANGIWGTKDSWVVYDNPYFTYGKTVTQIAPDLETSGAVSVPGPFYGFQSFVLFGVGNTPPQSQPYSPFMGLHIKRLDPTDLHELGTFTLTEGTPGTGLANMRHFATSPDSYYELSFPEEANLPTNFQMTVDNMMEETDLQVIGVKFDGALTPTVRFSSGGSNIIYTKVNSLAEVGSSTGETYFQDKANNLVWVKLKGGKWKYFTQDPNVGKPSPDEVLYEPMILRIAP